MSDDPIDVEAALWMTRARDERFADWDGLTAWLEADSAHNLAYERAFAAHDAAGILGQSRDEAPSLRPTLAPASAPALRSFPSPAELRRVARPLAGAGLILAAAAAALLAFVPTTRAPVGRIVETRPGEQRMIRLDDGTKIALNGGSRIVLSNSDGRTARVERGEAMFAVVHDAERPFTVDVAGERLVDLGTRFDVLRGVHGTEVAVAEGAVLFDPEGAAVRLSAGRMLRKRDASRLVEVADIVPAAVGSWHSGRLVYRGAALSRVADDLGRLVGEPVEVAPQLANNSFTGVIVVPASDRQAFLARLGPLLGVAVVRGPDGYQLKARAAY